MPTRSLATTASSLLLITIFAALTVHAQFRSAIEGNVTDPSGGVVADAQVVLANVENGVSLTAKTNSAGQYSFPSLPPGKYVITVSATGFSSVKQENITLGGSEIRTVAIAMKVGDVSETVTITSDPTPIQSSEAKVTANISAAEIRNLPIAGRNILDLVSLAPGVTGVGNMSGRAGSFDIFSLVGEPKVNANGQRGDGNGYYVDGISANSNPDPGTVYVTLNPDSVAEFSIALNDYSAEYGRSGSIVVNAVSKSGSNNYHGSIFEYHQNNKLTARNVLQNTPNRDTGRILPVSRRNEFGFSLGGPIQKDKMFFFGSLDALRSSNTETNRVTLETPEFVNFLKTNFPNNVSTSLLTKYTVGDIGAFEAGTTQTVSQVMAVLNFPAPCVGTGPLGMPCDMPLRGTAVRSFAPIRTGLQWNVRVDRYFNDSKDRVHVNYQRRTADNQGTQFRTEFRNAFAAEPLTYYANVNWTHTFSPSMINEAAVGFTRFQGGQECSHCEVPPIATGAGGFTEGFGNGFSPAVFIQNDWNWRDVLSINRGTHSLKMGVEIFRDQENDQFSGPQQRPSYGFENVFDFAADRIDNQTGVNYDLRTGTPALQDVQYRMTTLGFFIQDNWKVKKNFSLNMGLRWDFTTNPTEKHGRMSNIKLGSGSTFQERITNSSVVVVPNLLEEHRIGYFAPRLSFAWTPSRFESRMSIRGGMGVFMNRWPNIAWTDRIRANPPYQAGITANTQVPTGPQPVYGLCKLDVPPFNCPFPTGLVVGVNPQGGPIGARSSVGGTAPDLKYAYSINRFFGIQYAFTSNWILEADYLGSQAVHLYTNINRNRFAGDLSFDATLNRFNQAFSAINYTDNSGWAHYNGATVSLNKRFNKGYTFGTSFTFGKTLSVQDATGVGRDSLQSPIIDAYNVNGQRGLAAFDIAKRLSFNLVYEVPKTPFGSGLTSAIFGNWQIGTIASFQDGYPFWVVAGQDLNGDGGGPDAPFTPAFGNSKHANRSDFLNGFMTAADFPLPPCTRTNTTGACVGWARGGDLGRNTFRGPGLANIDFSLGRSFGIPWIYGKEGAQFQFRAEFYNLFNRVNLDPRTVVTNRTAGNFSRATGVFYPRTVQLGARIQF
ncbi:MAG: TonB-dependent receptor [Acidobacteria bacterium]|nr:TonB-dependent receptor [Acidobacteriota bacterium]